MVSFALSAINFKCNESNSGCEVQVWDTHDMKCIGELSLASNLADSIIGLLDEVFIHVTVDVHEKYDEDGPYVHCGLDSGKDGAFYYVDGQMEVEFVERQLINLFGKKPRDMFFVVKKGSTNV